jgi:prepilin-type N-terminal cleavage/methylation domain-containing protein
MNRATRTKAAGFTLIEIMIALALLAMLMAAVGAAVHASMTNYRENEEMFRAMSTARQALMRITTDLRTASEVSSLDPAGQCTIDLDGDAEHNGTANWDITYQFDSAANTLNFIQYNADGTVYASNVLCRNVTGMTFTRTPATGDSARSVRISMTVTAGDHAQTVSTAAVIRRNL